MNRGVQYLWKTMLGARKMLTAYPNFSGTYVMGFEPGIPTISSNPNVGAHPAASLTNSTTQTSCPTPIFSATHPLPPTPTSRSQSAPSHNSCTNPPPHPPAHPTPYPKSRITRPHNPTSDQNPCGARSLKPKVPRTKIHR